MAKDCEQEVLSTTLKQFHSKLRAEVKLCCKDAATVWREHLADKVSLHQYSTTMHSLAKGPWAKHGGGRVKWCVDACEEYFWGGTLKKLLQKDLKRMEHNMPTLVPVDLLPSSLMAVEVIVEGFRKTPWEMLDVGSCYNPFLEYPQFKVTAIDIAPAVESVFECDFLCVEMVPPPGVNSTKQHFSDSASHVLESTPRADKPVDTKQAVLKQLPTERYDVVVFSLLLSYMPSTEQRHQCCVNAHKALRLHGLLLVITPDSSHQNKHAEMMKSWKKCIEELGFHRWRYIKDTHLHCMAFRKVQVSIDYSLVSSNHPMLYIPQDHQDTKFLPHFSHTAQQQDRTQYSKDFQDLPFAED